jgi:dihydrofolate reductase
MRTVTVVCSLTLDGVMQAPGRADEDERGGFTHGGWAGRYTDEAMGRVVGKGMARGADLLFGRRTYEDFHAVWPGRTDNPYTEVLDRSRKYVASRTLAEPLPWQNSTLLRGDAAESVAGLKGASGLDLVVFGGGSLVNTLHSAGLVDEYLLLIHPLVLGTGRRLFPEGTRPTAFRVVESVPTTTGVMIVRYQPE